MLRYSKFFAVIRFNDLILTNCSAILSGMRGVMSSGIFW